MGEPTGHGMRAGEDAFATETHIQKVLSNAATTDHEDEEITPKNSATPEPSASQNPEQTEQSHIYEYLLTESTSQHLRFFLPT